MIRTIAAAMAGLLAMMVTVFVVESTGHLLFPPPEGTDLSNPEMLKTLMSSLPWMALAFVNLAWALGAFIGALVACRITHAHHQRLAIGIGLVMVVLSVMTMRMIPHPMWMVVLAVVVPVPVAWLGARIATPQQKVPTTLA